MQTPDWTHFRAEDGTDPAGPCCLLEASFPVNELPRNYIWTLGYLGVWDGPEMAEISAQVRSYSREYLADRAKQLAEKRRALAEVEAQLVATREAQRQELERLQQDPALQSVSKIQQRIEAGPLAMARSLAQTAVDLATGGITDPKERMAICEKCPFMRDDQRCSKCGCFLPAKTRVKKATCPIGAW